MYPLPTRADGCRLEEVKQAESQMRKVEETGRAKKLEEAFEMASGLNIKCSIGDGDSRQKNLKKRLGLKLGEQEEQRGRFHAAYQWCKDSGNTPEAERVKLKQLAVGVNEKNHNVQWREK